MDVTSSRVVRLMARGAAAYKNRQRSNASFANINLIGPCNLQCNFCLGHDLKAEFNRFNNLGQHFEEWPNFATFLALLKANGIGRIYITGQNTDPLLYGQLGGLVDYLKGEGFYVGVRTNGIKAGPNIDTLNRFDSTSITMLSLNPATYFKITGRKGVPDWGAIIAQITTRLRLSTVITRHNAHEIYDLINFVAQFPSVRYLQVRKTATDTRYGLLKRDMQAFEEMYERLAAEYPQTGEFEAAPIHTISGVPVVFWRTVATTVNSFNYWTNGVYTDDYFVIEGYLRRKHRLFISETHEKARHISPAGYPARYPVSVGESLWSLICPAYAPQYYVSPEVLSNVRGSRVNGWADPDDIRLVTLPESSYEGKLLIDEEGYPLNPKGRTGIVGRGDLGRWGPNYAIDPIITRFNKTTGEYEMLAVQRPESELWAIPGFIKLDGEEAHQAIKRRLGAKIGCNVDMANAVSLYKGYVDDPRNTDNAWLETDVLHLHLDYDATVNVANQIGANAKWVSWLPMDEMVIQDLYANHGEFVSLVKSRLNPDRAYTRKQMQYLARQFKGLLQADKAVAVVFDVHGTLLQDHWNSEYREVYKRLLGEYPSLEWLRKYVINKLNDEALTALVSVSGKSADEVTAVISEVRAEFRAKTDLPALPGALAFTQALAANGIPMFVLSRANETIVRQQLATAGFTQFVDESNIHGRPDNEATYDDKVGLQQIQAKVPDHTLVSFNDWYYWVLTIQQLGGINFGLPQGESQEFALNQERLINQGVDFILHGWSEWPDLLRIIVEHNQAVRA